MGQMSAHKGWVDDVRRIDIFDNLNHIKGLLSPEDSILDVGCYAGYARDFFRNNDNYLGIDLFPEHIELAREYHPDCPDKFKVGDLFELEDKADVVVCSRVLIHIPNFKEAVAKLIAAANRLVVAVIKIEPVGRCERFSNDKGSFWQRSFSGEQVNEAFGECQVATFRKYSNVYKFTR